jgi:ubiquinone/menaquinone biosynthesis C-methylase UbiE
MALQDQLFLAPIKPNPQNVLDMGTGTGIWAIDFGERCRPELLSPADSIQQINIPQHK